MKTFRTFLESFVPPDSNTESESGYLYHATNVDNADSIAGSGLKPFPPHHGTDQSCWPDGKRDKRVYFSQHANKVWMFAPEEGKPVILRVPKAAGSFKAELTTGDIYSNQSVPARVIDILDSTSGWMPLLDAF